MSGNQYSGKKVLLLGGAGYIGSALFPKLLARGHNVVLLDLFLHQNESGLREYAHPNLTVIRADFRDDRLLPQVMGGVDIVIHLGGIVGDAACELNHDLAVSINVDAVRTIGRLAKAHGVNRFLYASTCAIYGSSAELASEASHPYPGTLYAATKVEAETALGEISDAGFQPTVLRFASLYGLSTRKRFDLVVNAFAASAKIDRKIRIHGGDQFRPFIHVDDAARAICAVMDAEQSLIRGEVYNVGGDEQNYTIRQIADRVCQRVPGTRVDIATPSFTPVSYRVSFQKICRTLGFSTEWTVDQGICQVLDEVSGEDLARYTSPHHSDLLRVLSFVSRGQQHSTLNPRQASLNS